MIRIELSGEFGAVYPLAISRGVELSNDRDAGDDVLHVHDGEASSSRASCGSLCSAPPSRTPRECVAS